MNLEICHRSGLIYDEKLAVIELFWHAWQGATMLVGLPLEMLSTCTCYSRLHWRWFGYVSPSYCTTWPSLVLARFRFLLDHVLVPCCSTCQFSTGTHVVLPLDHVSFLHWTTCRIFIGPRVCFLFDHVSRCCPSTCHVFIRPRGLTIFFHVSSF